MRFAALGRPEECNPLYKTNSDSFLLTFIYTFGKVGPPNIEHSLINTALPLSTYVATEAREPRFTARSLFLHTILLL